MIVKLRKNEAIFLQLRGKYSTSLRAVMPSLKEIRKEGGALNKPRAIGEADALFYALMDIHWIPPYIIGPVDGNERLIY